MKIKRLSAIFSATVLSVSSLLTMGFSPLASAIVNTCVWTGATDLKFSTATNWTGCNSTAPQAGDIIKFNAPTAGGARTLVNDLAVSLGGVVEGVAAASGVYHINQISLADGAALVHDALTACTGQNIVQVDFTNVTALLNMSDTAGMSNNSKLTVAGNYATLGYVTAAAASTVAGNVIVVPDPNPNIACGGGIGGSVTGSTITGFTINGMTVQNGGSTQLADISFPLTLGGGSSTTAPSISFTSDVDGSFNPIATTRTISGAITLLSDAQFYVGSLATVNITGAISGANFAITRANGSQGVLNNQSTANTSKTGAGTQQNVAKTTTISDSQPTINVNVGNLETTVLDGDRGFVSVFTGGILQGNGTATDVAVNPGGIVAPGHSPGKLTISKTLYMSAGSTLQEEIQTKTNYDQLVVSSAGDTTTGAVNITNAVLDTTLYKGYSVSKGDTFTIINNLGTKPVLGTFTGLAEGATFKVGNITFAISYVGGDGNDVVLTAQNAASAPDTGFALAAAHPLQTLMVTTLVATMIGFIAIKSRASTSRR